MKPCCLKLAMCFLFTWTLIDSSVQCVFYGEQSVLSCVQCWLSVVQCAECSWLCGVQLCSRRRRVGCGGRIRPAASHYLLHSAQPSHLNCIQPAGFPQHTKHRTLHTLQTAHTTHCSLTVHTANTTDMSHCTPDYTVCYTFYLTSNFLNCHCLKLTKGENRAAAQIFFSLMQCCLSRTWVGGQIKSNYLYPSLESRVTNHLVWPLFVIARGWLTNIWGGPSSNEKYLVSVDPLCFPTGIPCSATWLASNVRNLNPDIL